MFPDLASVYDTPFYLIKQARMPGGRTKPILKDRNTGEIVQRVI